MKFSILRATAIFFILNVCTFFLFAEDNSDDSIKWEYIPYFATHYSRETGLPYLNMSIILQDRFGFLYFGTQGRGLFKYDGHTWRQFSGEKSGLADDRVMDMVYDGADTIYIVHPAEGITLFNIIEEKGTILNFNARNQKEEINKVLLYPPGYLSVTTAMHGMFRIDLSTGQSTYFAGSNPKLQIFGGGWQNFSAAFIDSTGFCWFGTSRGVVLFNGEEFFRYFPFADSVNRDVRQIAELSSGEILVFTDRFIGLVNREKGIVEECPLFPDFNTLLKTFRAARNICFLEDGRGRYFFATTGGIKIYDPVVKKYFDIRYEESLLVANSLSRLFEDREDNIWALTEKGITKLRPSLFQNFDKIQGINMANVYYDTANFVRDIVRPKFRDNKNGTFLYFREDYFFAELFEQGYQVYNYRYLNEDPNLRRIVLWGDELFIQPMWTSVYHRYDPAMRKFQPAELASYSNDFLDYRDNLFRYYSDDTNTQHLLVTDKQTGEKFEYWLSSDVGLWTDRVELFVDRENPDRVWLTQCRDKAAAYYFDMKEKKVYFWSVESALSRILENPVSIQNIIIWHDKGGRFWVLYSSQHSRIFRYEKGDLVEYTNLLNLEGKSIVDIKVDRTGRLLLATENAGLFVYDGHECLNYSTAEGLPGDYLLGGISVARDGSVFVMSPTILSKLNDSVIQKPVFNFQFYRAEDINNNLPDILLTDKNKIFRFPFGYRDITLYAGTNSFLSEKDLRYSFLLEKVHRDWIEGQGRNYINLTSLAPGSYIIRARVLDHLNRFEELTFSFFIPSYWYETLVVKISGLLLLAGSVFVMVLIGIKWNTRRLRKQAVLLEKIVAQRTTQLEETQQKLLEAAHIAGRADVATEVLHVFGNILNSISIRSELMEETYKKNLPARMIKANELIQSEGILNFELPEKVKQVLDYYGLIGKELEKDYKLQGEGLTYLFDKIDVLKLIIHKQDEYARYKYFDESINLVATTEETLTFLSNELKGISLHKKYPKEEIVVRGQKSKVLYILISLCRNAIEAVKLSSEKKIQVEIIKEDLGGTLRIIDSGPGIAEGDLEAIFKMDITTIKEKGETEDLSMDKQLRSFTLHTCANFMAEMKGRLYAASEGLGKGSVFILKW